MDSLAQSKKQTFLSRIWTWIADSIFIDDNHYAVLRNIKARLDRMMKKAI